MNFTPVLPGAAINLRVSLHFRPLLFFSVFSVFPFKRNTLYSQKLACQLQACSSSQSEVQLPYRFKEKGTILYFITNSESYILRFIFQETALLTESFQGYRVWEKSYIRRLSWGNDFSQNQVHRRATERAERENRFFVYREMPAWWRRK